MTECKFMKVHKTFTIKVNVNRDLWNIKIILKKELESKSILSYSKVYLCYKPIYKKIIDENNVILVFYGWITKLKYLT